MNDPKAGEQVNKPPDVFSEKHNLSPPFVREPADLFQGIDLPAFISDAMIFIKSHAKKGENPASMLPVPSGRAENVQITGESAVATLSGKEIKVTRISGRWVIRLG